METILHDIQRRILTELMHHETEQRYSDLQLPDIENDLYNYHLQNLVKRKLISKAGSHYTLTQEGKQLISKFNSLGDVQQFFKVSVALAVFRNDYTEILVQKRLRNPFYGDITSVAGKILYGEKIIDAARRKLLEETNLAAQFSFIGVIRKIKRSKDNTILEDTFYHYCIATDPVGVLIEKNSFGENFWSPMSNFMQWEKENNDTGEYDIAIWNRFMKKDFSSFYFEQDVQIKQY